MTALVTPSGERVYPESYVRAVEDQSRVDHEKLQDTEVRLLYVEQEKSQLVAQLAVSQYGYGAARKEQAGDGVAAEMKWRRRFFILGAVVFVGLWLATVMMVIPHWPEIQGWFR